MKRLLWLGAGLAIGALVVRAVTKKAQSYTPRGIAAAARDSGQNLVDSVRDFVDDVRDGMHEREQELRAAFVDGVPLDDDVDEDLEGSLDDFDEVFGDAREPNRGLSGDAREPNRGLSGDAREPSQRPGERVSDQAAGTARDAANSAKPGGRGGRAEAGTEGTTR